MLTLKGLRSYNRYQAALGHLSLSLIVFAILGYLVYFCWYPQPLFAIDAGWQGLRILAFVDFVLGPFITLFIFNPKKKELFKDLAIIALIQVSALSYGTYHVYQSRPAVVVYADQTYYTMAYSELEHFPLSEQLLSEIPLNAPLYKLFDLPRENTSIEYAVETDDFSIQDKIRDLRFESVGTETPFYLLESHHKDYKANVSTINKYTLNLEAIQSELNGENLQILKQWLKLNPDFNNYTYAVLVGRYGSVIVQVDSKTGNFTDFIPVDYSVAYM